MEAPAAVVVPLVNAPSPEELFTQFLLEVSRAVSLAEVNVAAGIAAQALLGIVG
jgi:hypothetical protein